jgi:hypothetical protein
MSIAERINPDNLNIHQFQEVPEARPELPFDVNQEITNEDRTKFIQLIQAEPNMNIKARYAALYKNLWPNEDFPIPLPLDDLVAINNTFDRNRHLDSLENAYAFKIIYPKTELPVDPELWTLVELGINNGLNDSSIINWAGFIADAARYKVIKPYNNDSENIVLGHMEEINSRIMKVYRNDWYNFIQYVSSLRLLNKDYKPLLTKEDWDILVSEMHRVLKLSIAAGLINAFDLKILAAHKVEVTAPGVIDIQMYPPDINQSPPSIPETRKF